MKNRARIWIDVEDLFEYARHNSRPSGIQRVAFEIQHALEAHPEYGPHIVHVRHGIGQVGLRAVSRAQVRALYDDLSRTSDDRRPTRVRTMTARPDAPSRLRRAALNLPTTIRVPLGKTVASQAQTVRHLRDLVLGIGQAARGGATQYRKRRRTGPKAVDADTRTFDPRPGDVFLALGAPWANANYGALLKHCREAHGLHTVVLFYDLIPMLFPEWCPPGLSRVFGRWYSAVIAQCDTALTISEVTREDMRAHAAEHGLPIPERIHVIPMGTTFSDAGREIGPSPLGDAPPPYVLAMGTIEARKNHMLLFRVWRRMLRERPASEVPRLVLAGREGWLVSDLMQQIENSNFLNGHIVIVDSPNDAEVNTLYRDCLFSVFPSFYEGWGLPVSESHALGKLCLVSAARSLDEASGPFTHRFDPDCVSDALDVITGMIDDPAGRIARETMLRDRFRPIGWHETADRILSCLP